MGLIDRVERKVIDGLNAEGRSTSHVLAGLAICAALVTASAALSAARPTPPAPGAEPSRHPMLRAVWPSLFSLTTIAALRVRNAPPSVARDRALGLWAILQASNLGFVLWRPRARTQQAIAAVATAGLTAAYAHAAASVDQKAATITAPTGFAGLASLAATPG